MTEQEIEQRERYARAIGRIAFGALMLAGVAILLRRMHDTPVAKVNEVIASIWIAAAFWGFVVRYGAVAFAAHKDLRKIYVISFALPTLGIALVLPLSLHLLVAIALGLVDDFDKWARWSLMFAGPAHIAFAFLATRRAVRLAQGLPAQSSTGVFANTLLVASIPFALIFVPVFLVAVTGLPILPLLRNMRPIIERERPASLPVAIVVHA